MMPSRTSYSPTNLDSLTNKHDWFLHVQNIAEDPLQDNIFSHWLVQHVKQAWLIFFMFCKLLKMPYSILYSPTNLYSLSNTWLILSTQHPFRCEGCIGTEPQAIGSQVWNAGSPPEDKEMNHKQKMESSVMFHVTLFLERTGRRKSIKRTETHSKSYFFILVLLWWSRMKD